jgi:hypothetical protein
MPWTCPACHLPIRHSELEREPRAGVAYRCHICRLELRADPHTRKMVLAPMSTRLHDHDLRPLSSRRAAATHSHKRRRRRRLR